MKKKPIILGIETSCDETAIAVIKENDGNIPEILSNVVSSQVDVHKEFGGVVPELAARSHIEKIDLIAKKAMEQSGVELEDIDAWGVSNTLGKYKEDKFKNSSTSIKKISSLLTEQNIKLGIEPLNRYETDFINTVDEGLKLCELIDHPNVGLLLDVYHMNIEEKNICQSIEKAKDKLFHLQVAENDRGIPGTGSINWLEIFNTLKKINYNKNVSLEMFIQANVDTSKDLFTWRNIENDPYDAIVRSFVFLNEHLNA